MRLLDTYSDEKFDDLWWRYYIRRKFALNRFKDYETFTKDELYQASENLSRLALKDFFWTELSNQLAETIKVLESLIIIDRKFNPFDYEAAINQVDYRQRFLLITILSNDRLCESYYTGDIKVTKDIALFDTTTLIDFDLIVELLATFKLILYLSSVVITKSYDNAAPPPGKKLPDLPDCFVRREEFDEVMKYPQIQELYTQNENGEYRWAPNKKNKLAGFAHRLNNTGKLKPGLSNQDLARIFCPYFNIPFNPIDDRVFHPDRARFDEFNFIR